MTTGAARPSADPRWWRDLAMGLGALSVLFVVGLWALRQGLAELGTVTGALHSVSRLAGLLASDLLLVQVFLMARIPLLEKAFGQDHLTRVHRLAGFTSFCLMLAHVALTLLAYASSTQQNLWGTAVDLVLNYPGVLLAVAGFTALTMVVVTSLRRARVRLRYESWHLIHLYAYLGAGLALPHQLWTGQDFVGEPVATVFWWGLYASALACVAVFRVGVPLSRSWRHRLVVEEVHREGLGVTSVVVTGHRLEQLGARAGQFLLWRFLGTPGWTRAHPYSLSAAPDGNRLRITVVHVGDGSTSLGRLRPGARVVVEGPYGRLHDGARTTDKVLLMASGIGVTPMRSLLEGMPGTDVVLLYRVHSAADVLFREELRRLARTSGARVVLVPGPRIPDRDSWLPLPAARLEDVEALTHLVPDVAERDVYLCGNARWMDHARAALSAAGVPAGRLHSERFVW